jgi:8-amino-3,8-dideoxy-alpha-D-manno-octulosonate transaminase
LFVIEDCCQAAGASYKGKRLGSIGEMGAFSLNVFKTITAGDGGAVTTNDYKLYENAFGFHDQGHKPNRMGLEIGNRSVIGMNLRINELTGAVALAQTRKIDAILDVLRTKKRKLKDIIQGANSDKFRFRIINDPGECGTLLVIIFNDRSNALSFCEEFETKTISESGWHVYTNMEHLLGKKVHTKFPCPFDCKEYGREIEYSKGMLPITDDILGRAVNISIGVVDKGLGAGCGINILSDDKEIEQVGNKIAEFLKKM